MKNKSAIFPVLFAVLFLSILFSCKKEAIKTAPTATISAVTNITATSASSGGEITADGGAAITARGVCWSANQSPTTSDSKTSNGSGTGSFTSSITGLTPGATYNIKSYATNSVGTGYSSQSTFTTTSGGGTVTVTDIDGNVYKTITIGTQVWMAENLKTTKYNDGTEMTNVTSDTQWANLTTGAYCNYDNLESNDATYGRLYNWYAVNTGKLAPKGWHVPTDNDWTILENYLIANGYNYDGTKDVNKVAKSLCAKTNWALSSEAGTPGAAPENNNSTGFTALPGGRRYSSNGSFSYVGKYGFWWSSAEGYVGLAYTRYLDYDDHHLSRDNYGKGNGFSVRLVRD